MKLDLKTRWKQSGKLTRFFAITLAVYFILLITAPSAGATGVLQWVTIGAGFWLLLRLARVGLRKLIWRLRNRLIVAYVLIAVVPILLIFTFVGLGGYLLAGQVAVYLARAELDRRVFSMREATDALMRSQPAARAGVLRQSGRILEERFPNVVLAIAERGTTIRWPEDSDVDPPASVDDRVYGVVSRGGRFYAWSCVRDAGAEFLAMIPLTRGYLSQMLPGLGDVYFLQTSLGSDDGSTQRGISIGGNRFVMSPPPSDVTATALPPPVNRFDLSVPWISSLQAADWSRPRRNQAALLLVHTRLSAISQLVLSRQADELQGLAPIFLFAVLIAFLTVEMVSFVIGVSLTLTITGAVHSLYEGTQRVMRSDFSHRIAVKGRDQLADLGRSFNTMTENLERLLAVAKEKERLQAEIEIARQVQEQLYPKTEPVMPSLSVTGLCHPARMVSGDYFDYITLPEDRLAIAIGDVAGKGISAALLMAAIQSALRMELRTSTEPAPTETPVNGSRVSTGQLVSDLNRQLYATTSPEKYATFCLALYDAATNGVTYTNAGHPPPILVRHGETAKFDVNGIVVGAFSFAKYGESKVQLNPGDLLVFYTDGVTEPENEYGEAFGEDRLVELVEKNINLEDRKIIEIVMESVRQWTGTPELFDDMTIVLARQR